MEFDQVRTQINRRLSATAGRELSAAECALLSAAWNGRTYEEESRISGYSVNYLQRDIGPRFWRLLSQVFNRQINKTTFRAVAISVLEPEASESVDPCADDSEPLSPAPDGRRIDWGDAPDASIFYGRSQEIGRLKQWMLHDQCRLIGLVGMGGVGKSTLASRLIANLHRHFEKVIWRSLRNAPLLEDLLRETVSFFSQQEQVRPTPEQLLYEMRRHRCLLILDNLETILQAGDRTGIYLPGYEGYGTLLRMLGESIHQGCVLLTSREMPPELRNLEGDRSAVRSHLLSGSLEASMALLEAKGVVGSSSDKQQVCTYFDCNPLSVKILSATIHTLFDGDLSRFLAEEAMTFNGLRKLLDEQFSRLAALEWSVLCWLSLHRTWTSTSELAASMAPPVSRKSLLESLESLVSRAMIEQRNGRYSLQPAVMEAVLDDLIERFCREISEARLEDLNRFSILKATAPDFVFQTQKRFVLTPLLEHTRDSFLQGEPLKEHFRRMLQELRDHPPSFFGYGAANLFHLATGLGLDLGGENLASLRFRQASFQNQSLCGLDLTGAELRDCTFTQTFAGILTLSFRPDGQRLALGDTRGTVSVWQSGANGDAGAILGQPLLTLRGHRSWIHGLCWHPEGRSLVSCSDDKTLRVWEANSGECLLILRGHRKPVWDVSWSPDGSIIASCSGDQTIRLWDAQTGECRAILTGHTNTIRSLDWSCNGVHLASASEDGTIRIWEICSAECVQLIQVEGPWVRKVAWSSDGCTLAAGISGARIQIWNGIEARFVRNLDGHSISVDSLVWSPDGTRLASGGSDTLIRIWDVPAGTCLHTLQGHRQPIWAVSWSADASTLASGSHDQSLRLWNPDSGDCLRTLHGHTNSILSVVWSPDGQMLATGGTDGSIRCWNPSTGNCQGRLEGHTGWVFSICWHPTRPLLASGGTDTTIRIWDTETGAPARILRGHTGWVWSVAWSPDGARLASGSSTNDLSARIWDGETGEPLQVLRGHESWIWWVRWSPCGQRLATAGDDQRIVVWDGSTGAPLKTLQDERLLAVALGWSPDGHWIATSGTDHSVRLWGVESGICERELRGHQEAPWAIGWSPDGRRLASGSDDGSIRLWDLQGGDGCVQELTGHLGRIWDLRWSPNGQLLASGGADETARVWDAATGRCLRVLRSDRPYEGMVITGVTGLSDAQKACLQALGAIEVR